MIDRDLQARFRFMRTHAGYVIGKAATGALELARAERLLDEAEELEVACTEWQDDPEPYDYDPGDIEDPEAYVRRQFESNAWTGPFVLFVKVAPRNELGWENGSALGGIVLGPQELADPYARVARAELAAELADDLRQAIGDRRDALEGVCV